MYRSYILQHKCILSAPSEISPSFYWHYYGCLETSGGYQQTSSALRTWRKEKSTVCFSTCLQFLHSNIYCKQSKLMKQSILYMYQVNTGTSSSTAGVMPGISSFSVFCVFSALFVTSISILPFFFSRDTLSSFPKGHIHFFSFFSNTRRFPRLCRRG